MSQDFLKNEVQESNTSDKIKADTIKALEQSKKIVDQNPEREALKKEYEEVRLATVWALKELRLSTSNDLTEFKDELKSQDPTLSDGEITQQEFNEVIQKETADLENNATDTPTDNGLGKQFEKIADTIADMSIEEILADTSLRREILDMNLNICPFLSIKGNDMLPLPELKNQILEVERTETLKKREGITESFMTFFAETHPNEAEQFGRDLFKLIESDILPENPTDSCTIDMMKKIKGFIQEKWGKVEDIKILQALEGILEYKKQVHFTEKNTLITTYEKDGIKGIEKVFLIQDAHEMEAYLWKIGVSKYEISSLINAIQKIQKSLKVQSEQSETAENLKKILQNNPDSLKFIFEVVWWEDVENDKVRLLVDILTPYEHAEVMRDVKNRIYSIKNKAVLLGILQQRNDPEIQKIRLQDIHESMRSDIGIIRALNSITASDINKIPPQHFKRKNGEVISKTAQFIRFGLEKENADIIEKILRVTQSINRDSYYGASVIAQILSGPPVLSPQKQEILKDAIPLSYYPACKKQRIDLWRRIENIEVTENSFQESLAELKTISSWENEESVRHIVDAIDRYIEQSSSIRSQQEAVKLLIDKWYVVYASHIFSTLTNYIPNKEDESYGDFSMSDLQKHMIETHPRYIQLFGAWVIAQEAVISNLVKNIDDISEIQQFIGYIDFSSYGWMRALYNGISEKFSEKTAMVYIAADKRFIDASQKILASKLSDEKKVFIKNMLLGLAEVDTQLQESKQIISSMSADPEQQNDMDHIYQIYAGMDTSLSKVEQNQAIDRLKNLFYKPDIEKGDYHELIEMLGTQENVGVFLQEISKIKAEEAQAQQMFNAQEALRVKSGYPQKYTETFMTEWDTPEEYIKKVREYYDTYIGNLKKVDPKWEEKTPEQLQELFLLHILQEFEFRKNSPEWENVSTSFRNVFTQIKYESRANTDVKDLAEALRTGKMDELDRRNFVQYQSFQVNSSAVSDTPNNTTENISQYEETKQQLIQRGLSSEEIQKITDEELITISSSKEALDNFIDFNKTLTELNLEEFWEYRNYVFQAIQSKSATSGLDTQDSNYLSKSEVSLFLFTIADSISESGEVSKSEKGKIEAVRSQKQDFGKVSQLLRTLNKQDSIAVNQEDTSILRNESRVGKLFRERFFGKDESVAVWFKMWKFLKSIK